jgi:hypothetical protein
MDATDRLLKIQQLQRDADEGRRRIAEREARREADPNAMHEWLVAEHRETGAAQDLHFTEPLWSPRARSEASEGVLYRAIDGAAPAPAVNGGAEPSDADQLITADAFVRGVGGVIIELRQEWRREMARLHRQFASWRKEKRHERMALEDEIKALRKRLDLADGTVVKAAPRGRRRKDGA